MPYSKLIIRKSQVFLTRSYVFLNSYTQIRDRGGAMCPPPSPPGPNRVKSAKRHGCRCRTIRNWSNHTSLLFRRIHPSAIAWRMRNMSGIHNPLSLLISCHIHPPHRVDHIIIKSRVWRSSWGALVIRLQWRIGRQMPWLPKCPNWRGSSIS